MKSRMVQPILIEIPIPPLLPAVFFSPAFIAMAYTSKQIIFINVSNLLYNFKDYYDKTQPYASQLVF